MKIQNNTQLFGIQEFYGNEAEEDNVYDLDVKIKEATTPSFDQAASNVVGCGGGPTVTACSGGCCQSVCSSC